MSQPSRGKFLDFAPAFAGWERLVSVGLQSRGMEDILTSGMSKFFMSPIAEFAEDCRVDTRGLDF
jgi:hypothetical protein